MTKHKWKRRKLSSRTKGLIVKAVIILVIVFAICIPLSYGIYWDVVIQTEQQEEKAQKDAQTNYNNAVARCAQLGKDYKVESEYDSTTGLGCRFLINGIWVEEAIAKGTLANEASQAKAQS